MNSKNSVIIRVLSLLLLNVFFSGCFAQRGGIQQAENKTVIESPDFVNDILFYVNAHRKSKGLTALEMNPVIATQAKNHSSNMAAKKVAFSHDGFENRVQAISSKLGAIRASAENVAYGHLSPEEVVDVWLKSPGHRKNIEGSKYTITGIGIAKDKDGTIFFTQIFAAQ